MDDSRLIFLVISVGIPLALIGYTLVLTWWHNRGDTVARRQEIARERAKKAIPRDAEWARLSHAYGDAGDIPYWLSKMSPDGEGEAWHELWSSLCHQGTVYDASFAALPAFRDAARSWARDERAMPLSLAGAIVAGHDQSPELEALYRAHARDIADLRELCLDSLRSRRVDGDTYIALLQALAAFEDIPVWRHQLDGLSRGELEGVCPACGCELAIDLGACHPRDPARLTGSGARLHALASAARQHGVAELLTRLFGDTECRCGARFTVPDAIA